MRKPHRVSKAIIAFSLLLFVDSSINAQSELPARNEQERGIKLLQAGEVSKALSALKKATTLDASDPDSWYYLGVAYVRLDSYKKACEALEAAIKLKPSLAPAHTALAFARMSRGQLNEAAEEAETSLRLDGRDSDAHYTLGLIQLQLGKVENAVAQANLTIEEKPNFAEAYRLKSEALVAVSSDSSQFRPDWKTRYKMAAAALEKYLELSTDTDKSVWNEQLESLRIYGGQYDKQLGDVHTGNTVLTKPRLTAKPEPEYTEVARRRAVKGTVILRVVFASDGTVKHILVLQGLPFGLTERAVGAARRIKFIPATVQGQPVSMFMQLEYIFNLY